MRLSSFGNSKNSKKTEVLHWWPERDLKHQPATSTTTVVETLEKDASGILGSDLLEQKKGNRKLFLKYILRQLNSKDVKGSDDGGSSWYIKLHNHLRVSFPKKAMHLSVPNKISAE